MAVAVYSDTSTRVHGMADDEAGTYDGEAVIAYLEGRYEVAHVRLSRQIEEVPEALGACFSILYTCERVITTVPNSYTDPKQIGGEYRTRARIALFRKDVAPPEFVRCKWCGQYTAWRDESEDNRCIWCGTEWPSPSWSWDNPQGMAMCAGRSWSRESKAHKIWRAMCDRYEQETGETMI